MTDLFEEVEEQIRSDRYRQFGRKILPWLLGAAALALVVTLGYWGYDTYRTQQIDKASDQYAQAMEAITSGDPVKAKALWLETSKSGSPAYKAMSLMHLGGFALQENKPADAVKLFDEAAKAAPDILLGDAARLKSAFALLDTASLKDLEARLEPLMKEGHPYRVQAREALAFAKLNAGDMAGARSDFVVLSQLLDAAQGARARAQAAIGLIDAGSAKAVTALVRESAALPPQGAFDPNKLMSGGPSQPQSPPQ